jgi:osmotically-inducible protein OsmY
MTRPVALLPPRPTRSPASDDRQLAERVERALRATGYGSLTEVAVAVHVRLVVPGGRVPSYYLKQVAQATALSVAGVERVRNDLKVVRPN